MALLVRQEKRPEHERPSVDKVEEGFRDWIPLHTPRLADFGLLQDHCGLEWWARHKHYPVARPIYRAAQSFHDFPSLMLDRQKALGHEGRSGK